MNNRSLIEVIKFLTLEEMLLSFQSICKQWRRAGTADEIYLHYLGDQTYLTAEQRRLPLPQRLKEAHQNLDFHDYLLHLAAKKAHIWNLPTDTISTIESVTIYSASKYVLNSKTTAIVTGGRSYSKSCIQIDLLTGEIESLPDMCEGRLFYGITILRGEVYVSGGCLPFRDSATAEKLTPEGWKMIPSMNQTRYGHTLTAMQSNIYALGGRHDGSLKSIEKFDGETWTLLTLTLPFPCCFPAVVRQGSNLYLISCFRGAGDIYLLRHWETWTKISNASVSLSNRDTAALRHRIIYFFDFTKRMKIRLDNDNK